MIEDAQLHRVRILHPRRQDAAGFLARVASVSDGSAGTSVAIVPIVDYLDSAIQESTLLYNRKNRNIIEEIEKKER